jgi:hypothetical protein
MQTDVESKTLLPINAFYVVRRAPERVGEARKGSPSMKTLMIGAGGTIGMFRE